MIGFAVLPRGRGRLRVLAVVLLTTCAPSCANTTAQSEGPGSRGAPVVGLEPLPITTAGSPGAGGSASPSLAPTSATAMDAPPRSSGDRSSGSAGPGEGDDATSRSSPSPQVGCTARVGALGLKRPELLRTLDAGLGAWLQGVDVEPKVERGRFQGWLVRSVYPGHPCWADVDLRAGDIVARVNNLAIERPEEAQAVWTALRTSNDIVVQLVRNGRPRTLRFSIVQVAN